MKASFDLVDRVESWVDPLAADELEASARLGAFLEAELPPGRGAALEGAGAFPDRELRELARAGIARALVPEDQGGTLDWARAMRLASRFAAYDLDVTLCLGGTVLASIPILVAGTAAQRAQLFGPILAGEMAGLALSEWEHGSDLLGGSCRAEPADGAAEADASAFVLRGEKSPTNNGSRGANVVVLARTSDAKDASSHTLFLLSRGTPGLEPHRRYDSLGYRTMDLSGVRLEGARVPRTAAVGGVGEGFVVARRSLEISRSGVATMALGAHAAAVSMALGHAATRNVYGAPIEALGGVRRLVANVTARLVVAAALVRRAARGIGAYGVAARAWSSAAKLVAPALLEQSVHDAGTILGARSLMNDLPFARLRRAAPVLAIFDGSSQLQLDELWRHAGGWRDGASADDVRAALSRLHDPARRPFVADAEDGGVLATTSPPAVLAALGGDAFAPFAEAARAVTSAARALRGRPQGDRFRASELAGELAALSATLEARDRTGSDAVDAALRLYAASIAPSVAAGLVELGGALDLPDVSAVAPRVLSAVAWRSAAEARVADLALELTPARGAPPRRAG